MIEAQISKNIWNNKYRYMGESENDFYYRLVSGLFDGLSDDYLSKYYTLVEVSTRVDFYTTMVDVFCNHQGMLAGRALYSLGTDKTNQSLSNCFVVPIEKDSMESIMEAAKNSALTMKSGGGVGYNFSVLRPKGSVINSSGASSTGVLSFMNIFNTTCGTIEAGGNRRGAQIGILGIWHPDLLGFITCKRGGLNVPDELKPFKNFNLSIFVSDDFMKVLKEDGDWDLIFPETSFYKYDEEWDGNIKAWLAKGYPIKKYATLKATDIWDTVMKSNYSFAEPGILFEDTINKNNTLYMTEYIMACNPCGEQPLIPNASCNLGSINLARYVKDMFKPTAAFDMVTLKSVIVRMVIMLDRMLDVNYYPLSAQALVVKEKRQIGLGITGLGDMLPMMCLKYSSEQGRALVAEIMAVMRETAYKTNVELSKVLGAFPEWLTYSSGTKDKFITGPYISTLPEDLKQDIFKYGLRCSRMISIAPTGTMSLLLNNVSGGAEPIFSLEYDRKIKVSSEEQIVETIRTYSWEKYLEMYNDANAESKPDFFETVAELKVEDHLNMQAILQKFVCTSISKTINVPIDYDYTDFKSIYIKAYELGLKGCTTYRPNDIIGSILTIRDNKNLCTGEDDDRPSTIILNAAPRRPKELPCDIIFTNIKGESWTVLVGLLDERPFEIFVGNTSEDLYLPKSCKEGVIRKQGGGKYELEVKIRNQTIIYKDLASVLMTDGQRLSTRLISTGLRHGVLPKYIVEQMKKANGSISDFSTAVARVLSKYVGSHTLSEKDSKCPSCGEVSLIFEEGCVTCKAGCGYSRCS